MHAGHYFRLDQLRGNYSVGWNETLRSGWLPSMVCSTNEMGSGKVTARVSGIYRGRTVEAVVMAFSAKTLCSLRAARAVCFSFALGLALDLKRNEFPSYFVPPNG